MAVFPWDFNLDGTDPFVVHLIVFSSVYSHENSSIFEPFPWLGVESLHIMLYHTKTPNWLAIRRSRITRAHVLVALTSILALVLLVVNYVWGRELRFLWRTRVMSTHEPGCVPSILPISQTQSPDAPIPNIVHYVWLLDGREHLNFELKIFISVYSASLYFKPDTIYIHTDASPEQWEYAKTRGDQATRWTLAIATVKHNQVVAPTHTLACTQILKVQHKSDFVRTEQLHKYGGIYMDTDVIPLRDVKLLRKSGFKNIMGIEERGRVNNGFVMAQPGSILQSIFKSEQHERFDNRWTTHSVNLLSELSYRLQPVPMEVLVLGIKIFSPSSWKKEDIRSLFNPHTETPAGPPEDDSEAVGLYKVPTTFEEAVDYWNQTKSNIKPTWQADYSGSYVIHAFDGRGNFWPDHVDLEYIMARQSNYARAVYPAVKHAIDKGHITWKPASYRN